MMSGSKTLNFGVIMKLKKYDTIAIICVAVIVIISYITVNLLRNDEADTVVIYVDGKIEKKLDLNKNQEYKVDVDNGYNIVRIKDKKVRINITLPKSIINAIDAVSPNRSKWISDMAKRTLNLNY